MSTIDGNPLRLRLSAIALLLAIFASGAVAGAGLYRWAAHDHGRMGPPPDMGPRSMHRDLGLSGEQAQKVENIMQKYRPELEAVIRETFPRVKAVHDRIDGEIRLLLTDDQRRRFDAMKSHAPDGPGMGGPRLGAPPSFMPPGRRMGPPGDMPPPGMGLPPPPPDMGVPMPPPAASASVGAP
jgi:Spy/CpxP family protein refolding chaperone